MASVQPRYGGPGLRISYTPNAVITGGQVVERVAGSRLVQPAGAGSLVACGVALFDAPAARASIQGIQVGDANALVVVRRVVITVVASGAIAEGQRIICAAAGVVAAAGATPDARTVIGEAFEAATNGATFLALIY